MDLTRKKLKKCRDELQEIPYVVMSASDVTVMIDTILELMDQIDDLNDRTKEVERSVGLLCSADSAAAIRRKSEPKYDTDVNDKKEPKKYSFFN